MASSITASARGYTFIDANDHANGRIRQMAGSIDDCTMMCDKDPNCKSITWWDSKSWGSEGMCFTNNNKTNDHARQPNNNWFGPTPPQNYDKPATPVSQTIITTKSIQAVNTTAAAGGRYGQSNGQEYCRSDPFGSSPSGNQEVAGSGSCGRGKRCCRQDFLGGGACPIPGTISDVNKDGNDNVKCGYKHIDNQWIADHWDQLGNYFEGNDLSAVKQQYCDEASPTSIATNSTIYNHCKTFILSKNGTQPESMWYSYLVNTMKAKNSWYSDNNATGLLTEACKRGAQDTSTDCISAVSTIPTGSIQWGAPLITGLNTIVGSSTTTANEQTSIKAQVEAYCVTDPSRPECACRNAVKLGIENCSASIPGCADLATFKSIRDNFDRSAGQSYANIQQIINTIDPRVQSQACTAADHSADSGVLSYGIHPPGGNLTIPTCISTLNAQGATITAQSVTQECKISTGGTTMGPNPGPPPDMGKTINGTPSTLDNDKPTYQQPKYIVGGILLLLFIIGFFIIMGVLLL